MRVFRFMACYICLVLRMDANEEVYLNSCTCEYHVYNTIWTATVGEELQCTKKLGMQRTDAISILRGPDIVGHLP